MAAPNALLTLEEAKAHLLIASTVTTSDDRIIGLIDSASAQIERWCKTRFMQATITSEPQAGVRKHIFLNNYPVISVTSITDDDSNTVPSTDYYINKPTGKLSHFGRFPRPVDSNGFTTKWLVTYVTGWYTSFESIDASLKTACKRLVALDFESPTGGTTSVSVGSLSVSYASTDSDSTIHPSVEGLLSTFRRNICP